MKPGSDDSSRYSSGEEQGEERIGLANTAGIDMWAKRYPGEISASQLRRGRVSASSRRNPGKGKIQEKK